VKIDLHTHSNASDGSDSPSELITNAIDAGINVLALTDHDTVAGWGEAEAALISHPQGAKLKLVLGSEISCQDRDGTSIHMLGLLFDPNFEPLRQEMEKTRENRLTRMERIVARLNEAGIEITMAEVYAQKRDDATLGRPHLADALVARGHISNRDDAFTTYLHNGSKFYINHYSPSPMEAIRLIKAAGGVSIIAHPLASRSGRKVEPGIFAELIAAGLDGIEVHHRDNAEEEKSQLIEIAREHNLVVTGSSDYHGTGKMNRLAEFTTSLEEWERLEVRARERRVVSK